MDNPSGLRMMKAKDFLHVFLGLLIGLFFLFLTGCGTSSESHEKRSRPSTSPQITDKDVQGMMQQMMGKGPIEETPVTTDGV